MGLSRGPATERLGPPVPHVRATLQGEQLQQRRYRLAVVAGPDAGTERELDGAVVVGTGEGLGLRLLDTTVSHQHVELTPSSDGVRLRDLGSTNGTFIGGVRVKDALIETTTQVKLGKTVLQISVEERELPIPVAPPVLCGMVGSGKSMRGLFGRITQVAPSDASVLLLGETGVGKEMVARALHTLSGRTGALVVFDCGAVSPNLMESELFGHAKGAFTGASSARMGAFLEADGGTLFLDEVGELPLELQPKLLRVLEARTVKRLGEDRHRSADVRVISATVRDLAARVKDGRFREDLYYRLHVVPLRIPPLRDRLEDLPALVQQFAQGMGRPEFVPPPELFRQLKGYAWPGNLRELRNVLAAALLELDTVVLTPHVAGWSPEAGQASVDRFVENARRHLAGESPVSPV